MYIHIEAETKWPQVSRRYFTEVWFLMAQLKYLIIGSDNGLATTRQQAIILPNG